MYRQCWYLLKIFDPPVARCRGMMMSCQHTALLLRENTNEAENSTRFCTKKRNPFCFKTHHFPKSRIRYQWEFWGAEIWCVSVHELNVTIVKSYFDPNKFQEYLIEKIWKKKISWRKANPFYVYDSRYIFNVLIDFLHHCIGSVLQITHIYAYKYRVLQKSRPILYS